MADTGKTPKPEEKKKDSEKETKNGDAKIVELVCTVSRNVV